MVQNDKWKDECRRGDEINYGFTVRLLFTSLFILLHIERGLSYNTTQSNKQQKLHVGTRVLKCCRPVDSPSTTGFNERNKRRWVSPVFFLKNNYWQEMKNNLFTGRAIGCFLSLTVQLPGFTTSWLLFPSLVVPFGSVPVCLWPSPASSWKQWNNLKLQAARHLVLTFS